MSSEAVNSFKESVLANDVAKVGELLQGNPDLAAIRDENGVSVLLGALYRGNTEVASRISAERSDLDIFEAAAMGDLTSIRRHMDVDPGALQSYSADGFTPLHLATFFSRMEVMRYVLANGGDVEAIAGNDSRVRPIHSAAATRDVRVVRVILAAGADADAKQAGGHTALHAAVLHGNVAMTVALLGAGADAGIRNDEGKCALDFEPTGNAPVIKDLLRNSTSVGGDSQPTP